MKTKRDVGDLPKMVKFGDIPSDTPIALALYRGKWFNAMHLALYSDTLVVTHKDLAEFMNKIA